MPPSGRHTCATGKHRFKDRISALVALAESARSAKNYRNEVRAYECPRCRGWHLTSKALYERPQLRPKVEGERQPYERPSLQPEKRPGRRGDSS